MTKRSKALTNALAMYRGAKHFVEIKKDAFGFSYFTFWFPSGPKEFKRPEEMFKLANRIAKEALKK